MNSNIKAKVSLYLTPINVTTGYLCLMASLFLLVFGTGGYTDIFEIKTAFFCGISCSYIVCMLVLFVVNNANSKERFLAKTKSRLKLCHVFALLYMAFTLVSGFLSDRFPATVFGQSRFEGMFTISIYCITFILVSVYGKVTKELIYTFCLSVIIFNGICLLQLLGYNPFFLFPDGMNYYDKDVLYHSAFLGTIGNTNLVSAFMCVCVPLLLAGFLKAKGFAKWISLVAFLLSLFTVIFMNVTGAYVGLFAGFLVLLFVLTKPSLKKLLIILTILVLLFTAVLLYIRYADFSDGILGDLNALLNGKATDDIGTGRVRIWKNVISVIPESLIFGKGADTMVLEEFTPFSRYYPALRKTVTTTIDAAHSEPLNILYHQGLFALLSYFGVIGCGIDSLIKKSKRGNGAAFFGVAAAGYFIQSFFGISMCITAPYFWIALGFLCSEKSEF